MGLPKFSHIEHDSATVTNTQSGGSHAEFKKQSGYKHKMNITLMSQTSDEEDNMTNKILDELKVISSTLSTLVSKSELADKRFESIREAFVGSIDKNTIGIKAQIGILETKLENVTTKTEFETLKNEINKEINSSKGVIFDKNWKYWTFLLSTVLVLMGSMYTIGSSIQSTNAVRIEKLSDKIDAQKDLTIKLSSEFNSLSELIKKSR